MTRQDTHGIPCPRGCGLGGLWPWHKLDAAIISDGEDGLVWIWSCPSCSTVLRTEPFAYPPDMPFVTWADVLDGSLGANAAEIRDLPVRPPRDIRGRGSEETGPLESADS